MSLLLDALKKAAKEKKQAVNGADASENDEALELDSMDEASSQDEGEQEEKVSDELRQEAMPPKKNATTKHGGSDINSATQLTISSEALQELVHKTNKKFNARKRLIIGGVFLATILILAAGGLYFYLATVDDMAMKERKHRLVMLSAADTQLSKAVTEKIEQIKQKETSATARETAKNLKRLQGQKKATTASVKKPAENKMVITKSIQKDPIDVLVNKAWKAYESGDYESAQDQYSKALSRESNNRDALLGMAAIAYKQGEIGEAKSIYEKLVRLDPRDPIAVGALSNMEESYIGTLSESKLKSMIRLNDKAAHLHFALGNIYSQKKRWPEAQQSYFSAWQNEDTNADYAFNLAVSLDQLGKTEKAVTFYQMSLDNANKNNAEFPVEAVRSRLQQLSSEK